jgi:hypothetical protein
MVEDNSHAGQGPVVLDIGGDIGALVIAMPAGLTGSEIEARPVAGTVLPTHLHSHGDGHSHSHGDGHSHSHGSSLVHVGVLERSCDGVLHHTAVFGELPDGSYELYVRPDGPVQLTATVRGGTVTSERWPGC